MRVVLAGFSLPGYRYCLSLGYLKAYAQARPELAGRGVRIAVQQYEVDFSGRPPAGVRSVARAILREGTDVVGLSCYLWNIETSLELCRVLKRLDGRLKIVLGGPEASSRAEALLARHPEVDGVVLGEGEETFALLLGQLLEGGGVAGLAGLAWRQDGRPRLGPERPEIGRLREIPSPFLNGLTPARRGDCLVIETSRGCPFRCKFCDWQNGRPTRNFPVERVLEEVAAVLRRTDDVAFYFADADIFTDLPRARALIGGLASLARSGASQFYFQCYLPRIDEETFWLLDSPRFWLGSGVQSTNAATLRSVSRFFDRAQVEAAFERKRRRAPSARVQIQLIYGLPGDDFASFRASLGWALRQDPDQIIAIRHCVLPGSELGRRPYAHGIVREEAPPYRVLATSDCPPEDVERIDRWVCRFRFLNNEPWINAAVRKAAEEQSRDRLSLWDGLVDELGRVPEFGLEQAYARAGRLDIGFLAASGEWKRRLLDLGLESALRTAVERFLERAAAGCP